jgi:hypothetical protein
MNRLVSLSMSEKRAVPLVQQYGFDENTSKRGQKVARAQVGHQQPLLQPRLHFCRE